jgi:hypothetical protein
MAATYLDLGSASETPFPTFKEPHTRPASHNNGHAPKMTPSMGSALEDLELHRLLVIYPGSTRYTLRPKVEVMPLAQCAADLA